MLLATAAYLVELSKVRGGNRDKGVGAPYYSFSCLGAEPVRRAGRLHCWRNSAIVYNFMVDSRSISRYRTPIRAKNQGLWRIQ